MPILENQRHEKFAQLIATGEAASVAYKKVYKAKVSVADTNGPRLLGNARVKERVRELQGKAEAKTVLTIEEKREFLRRVVVEDYSGAGSEIKMPDKLRAIELDAKLAGELTEKKEVSIQGQFASELELGERIKTVSPLLGNKP